MFSLVERLETQVLPRNFYICRNFSLGAPQISRSVDTSPSKVYTHLLHRAWTLCQPPHDFFFVPPGKTSPSEGRGHWSRSQTAVTPIFDVKISEFRLSKRCFEFQKPHKVGSASYYVLVNFPPRRHPALGQSSLFIGHSIKTQGSSPNIQQLLQEAHILAFLPLDLTNRYGNQARRIKEKQEHPLG